MSASTPKKSGNSTCRNFSRRRERNILAETGHEGLGKLGGLEEGSENTCSSSGGSVHSEDLGVNFGTEVEGAVTGTADKTVAAVTVTVEQDEEVVAAAVETVTVEQDEGAVAAAVETVLVVVTGTVMEAEVTEAVMTGTSSSVSIA